MIKKSYGITLKTRVKKHPPISTDLTGKKGYRIVIEAAKKVIKTHKIVIQALGKR